MKRSHSKAMLVFLGVMILYIGLVLVIISSGVSLLVPLVLQQKARSTSEFIFDFLFLLLFIGASLAVNRFLSRAFVQLEIERRVASGAPIPAILADGSKCECVGPLRGAPQHETCVIVREGGTDRHFCIDHLAEYLLTHQDVLAAAVAKLVEKDLRLAPE